MCAADCHADPHDTHLVVGISGIRRTLRHFAVLLLRNGGRTQTVVAALLR